MYNTLLSNPLNPTHHCLSTFLSFLVWQSQYSKTVTLSLCPSYHPAGHEVHAGFNIKSDLSNKCIDCPVNATRNISDLNNSWLEIADLPELTLFLPRSPATQKLCK